MIEKHFNSSCINQLFSGWRKVVLETRIFFLGRQPEKRSQFAEPIFSNLKKNQSLQNHFCATHEITSNGVD